MKKAQQTTPLPFISVEKIKILKRHIDAHVAGSFRHCMISNAVRELVKLPPSAIISTKKSGERITIEYDGRQERYVIEGGERIVLHDFPVSNPIPPPKPFTIHVFLYKQKPIKIISKEELERRRLKAYDRYRNLKAAGHTPSYTGKTYHRAFVKKAA